ncbi:hypothetical protein VHEMI05390 [[Torrubiella] hemipterigena]|uniref:Lipase 1 n=1 Tax=[Torrubiella] hemipterigena TaxID=1531966 RepID=A0A0A1T400_9HYPO|nr:hypothetical protein VHEMI05390 [[Torrubiella] hemipterigena]
MPSLRAIALAALSASSGLAAPTSSNSSSSGCSSVDGPLPPSKDPWYTEPKGFESSPPGSVLRYREAPGNLTTLVNGTDKAWQILYRTMDSQYKPTFAVTTLFKPKNANNATLLSYQIPYDTADVDASPSYAMYDFDKVVGAQAIIPGLAAGMFVNVPDYEGPLASFTAGVISGHATLDSVRAVLNLAKEVGLAEDAKYAMWGYSGGALASEWAGELQVQYAPELNFSGNAMGGLTPNVTSVLYNINGQVAAGLAVSSMLGLGSQYPDILKKYVEKLNTDGPYNKTTFLSAYNMSLTEAGIAFLGKDISKYFKDGFDDFLNNETYKIIYNDGIMGYHGVPTMPMYMYKAVHDEISNITDNDALVEKYCNMGANIYYSRNSEGSHSDEGQAGALSAFGWLSSVLGLQPLSSEYPTRGCKTVNVAIKTNMTSS